MSLTTVAQQRHDTMQDADLITVPEAARRLGMHPDTLRRLCRAGQFEPALQIGAKWFVSVPRMQRLLHGVA